MKTLKLLGYAFFAISLFLTSCSKEDDPIVPTPSPEVTKSEITIDSKLIQNGLSFSNEKGEQSIDFSTNENWTLSITNTISDESWCTASSTNGSKGSVSVKFSVAENTNQENRSVSVTIKCGTVTKTFIISQEGADVLMDDIPYLSFKADAKQTFILSKAVETLEYSVNNGEWGTLGTSTVTFGGSYGELRLRGKSKTGTSVITDGDFNENYSNIKFENSVSVTCTGDIRTLVDYEIYKTVDTSNARFYKLFNNCNNLISAPDLPATTLAESCYVSMFEGCTSLTSAPELPATTLASNCYEAMFSYCESLTTAPKLPATTLANNCYKNMFYRCISLTSASELPATTLAGDCYSQMFYECSSLISAPELPATILASNCYQAMFYGCTSLTSAPKLPATTLASDCYQTMFKACISLVSAPELPATTLASNCYQGMFSSCTSLEIAPELPATILTEGCYGSMFSATSLKTAPELPATTLAKGCYSSMFSYCTSLTSAPKLPASTLTDYCYYRMFSNCSNLTYITMLATDTNADSCLLDWLNGVSSKGTFIKDKKMTPPYNFDIPRLWTIENYGEE